MRIAKNIDWDTDGEKIYLPSTVTIPSSVGHEETDAADYLSDMYGWCVNSLDVGQIIKGKVTGNI